MKTLYTAVATAVGGRMGHVETSDGKVLLDLSIPKDMGGPGGNGTNPEQLFASGYAACFGSAVEFLAKQQKLQVGAVKVTASVSIGPNDSGGFGLETALDVTIPGLNQAAAEKLVTEAHQVCPYSNATRGNMPVTLVVHGGASA